jgi:hypothetical protein
MTELLVLGAILAVPWLVLTILRVPSFVAFFSLLIGQLLATEASREVYEFAGSILKIPDVRYVQLALLLLPLVLTVLFLKGRVSKSKRLIEILPSLFVAATAVLLAYPFVWQLDQIMHNVSHGQIESYKTLIIVAASVSGLLSAWLTYPKPQSEKHGKKHK